MKNQFSISHSLADNLLLPTLLSQFKTLFILSKHKEFWQWEQKGIRIELIRFGHFVLCCHCVSSVCTFVSENLVFKFQLVIEVRVKVNLKSKSTLARFKSIKQFLSENPKYDLWYQVSNPSGITYVTYSHYFLFGYEIHTTLTVTLLVFLFSKFISLMIDDLYLPGQAIWKCLFLF